LGAPSREARLVVLRLPYSFRPPVVRPALSVRLSRVASSYAMVTEGYTLCVLLVTDGKGVACARDRAGAESDFESASWALDIAKEIGSKLAVAALEAALRKG